MLRNTPRRELLDSVLSVSAAVVALSALLVSVYQAKITREQQKMSAWPRLQLYHTGGNTNYGYVVHNVGVGPAVVRSATLAIDRRFVTSWSDVIAAAGVDTTKLDAADSASTFVTSSVRPGTVLLPAAATELLRVRGTLARPIHRLFHSERVRIRVCYCSVYADCWLADNQATDPDPVQVSACPNASANEFQS